MKDQELTNIEITVIAKPDITAKEIDEINGIVEGFCSVDLFENEGKKHLAYKINDYDSGVYLFWKAKSADKQYYKYGAKLDECENVIRYLIVRAR